MLLVGLTGGIGSGKTTVARMLADRGAVVVDADGLSRRALDPGTPGHRRVVEAFGARILSDDGSVDREALAAVVFAEPEKRRLLESIVHPEVFAGLQRIVAAHRDSGAVIVFDAALLVETGFDHACDLVIVISTPVDMQVRRLEERGMDPDEVRRRIAAQTAPEVRDEHADIVIPNAGDLEELGRRVEGVWQHLRSLAERGG